MQFIRLQMQTVQILTVLIHTDLKEKWCHYIEYFPHAFLGASLACSRPYVFQPNDGEITGSPQFLLAAED